MGVPVLILGESGSGKTYSIKNLDPAKVGIFSVEKNRLPFKGGNNFKVIKDATYPVITKVLKKASLKTYIIDDSQYLMVNEMFEKAKVTGYEKWTELALNFRNLIHIINHDLPDDVIVYFLHHAETNDNGSVNAKTVGKMLSSYLTVEGCFDIVLLTDITANEHTFITQSDGTTPCKSPEEMFEFRIPNDLAVVDQKIREYYGMDTEYAEAEGSTEK